MYPDFSLGDSVKEWWMSHCLDFYNGSDWGVEYDALWIVRSTVNWSFIQLCLHMTVVSEFTNVW